MMWDWNEIKEEGFDSLVKFPSKNYFEDWKKSGFGVGKKFYLSSENGISYASESKVCNWIFHELASFTVERIYLVCFTQHI